MAEIAQLQVSIGADIKRLEKGISRAQRKLQDAGRSMQRVGRSLTMGITAPMAAAGAAALNQAAKFESLQQSMNTLNGSVEEGTRNFERLKEFSATTPFQLQDLAEAQNMLQGFGLSADEAFESMSMIGDIAAVASGDIKGIGIAFGQAAAEGRLMTRDIRQLINQGVPAIKLLADTMGVAESSVLDLASEGEISFEILQQAFDDATSAGGMFANGMAKQARTLGGIWSTFKDNVSIALADVGQAMAEAFDIKGLADSAIATIQSMLETFNSLPKETKQMAFTIAGLLGASGPILVALGTLTAALGAISWPVVLGVAAVGGAVTAIASHWDSIVTYFTSGGGAEMWKTIKQSGQSLFATLKDLFKSIADFITAVWGVFGDDMTSQTGDLMESVVNAIEIALDAIGVVLDTFTLAFTGDWDTFWKNNEERVRRFGENIKDYFKQLFTPSNLLAAAKRVTFINVAESWGKQIGMGIHRGLFGGGGGSVPDLPSELQKQVDEATKAIKPKDTIIPAQIDFSMGGGMKPPKVDTSFEPFKRSADNAKESVEELGKSIGQMPEMKIPGMQAAEGSIADLQMKLQAFRNMRKLLDPMSAGFRELTKSIKDTEKKLDDVKDSTNEATQKAKVMGQALQSTVTSAITDFATTLGNAFTGSAGVEGFFNNLLMIVVDFANKFGKLLIAAGIAAQAFQKLLANPVAAIIAGTALVAATTAVKNLLQKGPQQDAPALANGGLAFGPTMAVVGDNKNARSNPEVIAPLDKLQGMMGGMGGAQQVTVKGEIRGDKILIAGERGKNRFR